MGERELNSTLEPVRHDTVSPICELFNDILDDKTPLTLPYSPGPFVIQHLTFERHHDNQVDIELPQIGKTVEDLLVSNDFEFKGDEYHRLIKTNRNNEYLEKCLSHSGQEMLGEMELGDVSVGQELLGEMELGDVSVGDVFDDQDVECTDVECDVDHDVVDVSDNQDQANQDHANQDASVSENGPDEDVPYVTPEVEQQTNHLTPEPLRTPEPPRTPEPLRTPEPPRTIKLRNNSDLFDSGIGDVLDGGDMLDSTSPRYIST